MRRGAGALSRAGMEALRSFPAELPLDRDSEAQAGAATMALALRPDWTQASLRFHFFTEGITNRILSVWGGDSADRLLFRIYGRKSEELIDRAAELGVMRELGRAGLAPAVHASFANGIVYAFVPGEVLDDASVREPAVAALVAQAAARLHAFPYRHRLRLPDPRPVALAKTQDWIAKLPDPLPEALKGFPSKAELAQEREEWAAVLEALGSPVVFAHNDLLIKNLVVDRAKGRVDFIDFEYAGPNYLGVELGNHFAEWAGVEEVDFGRCPTEAEAREWLAHYARAVEDEGGEALDVEELLRASQVGTAVAHFFWSLWAALQALNSAIEFDFASYAKRKMDEYKRLKHLHFPKQ